MSLKYVLVCSGRALVREAAMGLMGAEGNSTALEATLGQMDGFSSQPTYKCYLEEVASVGD